MARSITRDAKLCRESAFYFRQRAAVVTNDPGLRDSYFGLAEQYERLADVLERIAPAREYQSLH